MNDTYQTIFSTPVLEASTSTGLPKFWQGHVATDGENYFTYTTYWQRLQSGENGNYGQSAYKRIEGKNIGRSNATTPRYQAEFEIKSTMKKQMDRGYHEIGVASTKLTLPMLAHQFGDKAHTVQYPCYLQPKYDGMRSLSDGTKMWSRKGIEFLPGVTAHLLGAPVIASPAPVRKSGQVSLLDLLEEVMENPQEMLGLNTLGHITDGELILPPPYGLQDTVSAAKKVGEHTPKLLYRIYDIVLPDAPFSQRFEIAQQVVAANAHNPNIILSPTWKAENEDEIMEHHERIVSEGWEGTMVRVDGAGYVIGQRDKQLLKLKDFLEEEFVVVDIIPGKVEHIGGIFVCETKDGKRFNTTPKFPHEQRVHWLQHPEEVVGRNWVIRFQAYTKDGIPQFGRAICERIPEIQG